MATLIDLYAWSRESCFDILSTLPSRCRGFVAPLQRDATQFHQLAVSCLVSELLIPVCLRKRSVSPTNPHANNCIFLSMSLSRGSALVPCLKSALSADISRIVEVRGRTPACVGHARVCISMLFVCGYRCGVVKAFLDIILRLRVHTDNSLAKMWGCLH